MEVSESTKLTSWWNVLSVSSRICTKAAKTYRNDHAGARSTESVGVALSCSSRRRTQCEGMRSHLVNDHSKIGYSRSCIANISDVTDKRICGGGICFNPNGLLAVIRWIRTNRIKSLETYLLVIVLSATYILETVTSLVIEPCVYFMSDYAILLKRFTYNGDAVTTRAYIALKRDVTSLVDSKTIILVHDGAKQGIFNYSHRTATGRKLRDTDLFSMINSSPVVLTSNPSVLWPAGRPLLFAFGSSPRAVSYTHVVIRSVKKKLG